MRRDLVARLPYEAIWVIDFEFRHPKGHPLPELIRCMVARDVKSGRELRLWADELPADPPFATCSSPLRPMPNGLAS
jgi:hypothetical protein